MTSIMKTVAGLFVLLTMSSAAFADAPPVLVGEPGCRVAKPVLEANERVKWVGPCKDGYAEGTGVLEWHRAGFGLTSLTASYQVTMVQGRISGEGSAKYKNGDTYTGYFKDGKRDGKGYTAFANGDQYEGDYKNDAQQGHGTYVELDRRTYVGEWKAGKRDGIGTDIFALGGRYEGAWKAGKFDGKGVLTYAGSGRRHEGQFEGGRVQGTPVPAKVLEEHHALKANRLRTGSMFKHDGASGPIPFDKSYDALTPAQQAVVKASYLALEEGDEPPYPVNGLKPIYDWMSKVQAKAGVEGELRLYVLVGKDGNAVSVTTIGAPSAEIAKFATLVVAKEKYQPALCRGEPCEMMYPFHMMFDLVD